jgi:2-polyprenyl-6-methoxyphenol hydroxylase-like FAD-dependent oxidoreductase
MFALAPGKGFVVQRQGDGSLHSYAQLIKPLDYLADISFADADTVTAHVVCEFDGWAPQLTDSDTAPVVRRLYTLPVLHRWERTAGVTLLGDAAHLTPPNGEGANLAMFDGAELGQCIAAHPGDMDKALTAYEQAMFSRAAEAGGEDVYGVMLGQDAPYSWIAMMADDEQS